MPCPRARNYSALLEVSTCYGGVGGGVVGGGGGGGGWWVGWWVGGGWGVETGKSVRGMLFQGRNRLTDRVYLLEKMNLHILKSKKSQLENTKQQRYFRIAGQSFYHDLKLGVTLRMTKLNTQQIPGT